MRRFAVLTLGCKVSQYDGEALASLLEASGAVRVENPAEADVVLVNTCTVTNRADADARRLVRRVRRENPDARVVVTGCLAQRDPEGVAGRTGADLVVGNTAKTALPDLLERGRFPAVVAPGFGVAPGIFTAPLQGPRPGKSRAFLKIQEGCDQRCTFCIVPSVRGPERSVPGAVVVREVGRLAGLGYPEIVLCGVHLGSWGHDTGETLAGLLRELDEMPGRFRVRLSSIEPWGVDDDLLEAMAGSSRVAPHLHLPLQSGCDATLHRMRRPYTAAEFADLLDRVRSVLPRVTVGTDLIVGFPGEDEAEFEATEAFLESQPIDLVHVFSYSPRDGTPAARMKAPPQRVAKVRLQRVRRLFGQRRAAWLARQVGAEEDVVVLRCDGEGSRGLTGRYAPVRLDAALEPASLVPVRIVGVEDGMLLARYGANTGL